MKRIAAGVAALVMALVASLVAFASPASALSAPVLRGVVDGAGTKSSLPQTVAFPAGTVAGDIVVAFGTATTTASTGGTAANQSIYAVPNLAAGPMTLADGRMLTATDYTYFLAWYGTVGPADITNGYVTLPSWSQLPFTADQWRDTVTVWGGIASLGAVAASPMTYAGNVSTRPAFTSTVGSTVAVDVGTGLVCTTSSGTPAHSGPAYTSTHSNSVASSGTGSFTVVSALISATDLNGSSYPAATYTGRACVTGGTATSADVGYVFGGTAPGGGSTTTATATATSTVTSTATTPATVTASPTVSPYVDQGYTGAGSLSDYVWWAAAIVGPIVGVIALLAGWNIFKSGAHV